MRASLVFLSLLVSPSSSASDNPPLQRYAASLHLGDALDDIKEVYPPKEDWVRVREPRFGAFRVELTRANARSLPGDVQVMRLRFRWGRLAHIQVVYGKDYTRRKPLTELVTDFSLVYGEPRRAGLRYFWRDWRTVLRASNAEIPSSDGKGTELRTSLEVMNKSLLGEGN